MRGPLDDVLLRRQIDARDRAASAEAAPMGVLRRIRARDPAEDIHGRILVSFPPQPRRDHHGRARGTHNLRHLLTII